MIAIILAKVAPYILVLIAFVAGYLGLKRSVRKEAQRETALEAAERYAKTRKAMDDVENLGDPGLARRWLRERGE